MDKRLLGSTGLLLSAIGFGAFKLGRNIGVKYPRGYELPGDAQVDQLLRGLHELGVNYIDTAPAYGTSEQRLGEALGRVGLESRFVVSTKVGELFENGRSRFEYSERSVRGSIMLSRERLKRDVLDIVLVHSDGNDLEIIQRTDVVATLQSIKGEGLIRAIGFSGKTVEGARAVLAGGWADAIMVEYHVENQSHEQVIAEAAAMGVGVIVKKGLASGRLDAGSAVQFVLQNENVTSLVIGGLNLEHMRANIAAGGY